MRKRSPHTHGAALLITLAFIVLISILIVGFAASMRTDRPSANLYLEKSRATLYAQTGVETVIASLRQNTADTNRNWISQPGQFVVGSASDDPTTTIDERKVLQTVVPLHSGAAPNPVPTDPVLQPCNINVVTLRDPTTSLITDRPDVSNPSLHAQMQVAWIYVRKDGTRDTSQTPAVSTTNPIIGRFAYWTDDESSKVNYNLAWGRSTTPANSNQPGNPTKVSLAALTGLTTTMADAIHGSITDMSFGVNFEKLNRGFFNTPEEARQVDLNQPGISTALNGNKFEVTHYSNDPDTTFFNQPRIVLTTQASRAGGKPYLNIGVTDITKLADLEQPSGSQAARIQAYKDTVKMLVTYLKRTDWPMVSGSGSSFQEKYYGSYSTAQQNRLTQLAINIIDYVRSKESPDKVVIPTRGLIKAADAATGDFSLSWDTSNTTVNGLGNPANAQSVFLGRTRTPLINEMGMWYKQATSNTYQPSLKVELYLPRNYGISSIDLKGELYGMFFAYYPSVALPTPTYDPTQLITDTIRFYDTTKTDYLSLSKSVLNAGDYTTVTWKPYGLGTTGGMSISPYGRTMGMRIALFHYANATTTTSYAKADMVPLLGNYTNTAYYVPDSSAKSLNEANISSIEVDDPRISTYGGLAGVGGDWVQNTKNTFDAPNSRYSVGNAATTVSPQLATGEPQLDTDSSGRISDASLYMPPPAGQTFTRSDGTIDDNTPGMVTSVGELGYIDTGMESTAKRGLNWRTLRLQTSALDKTVVPDWALMDLFTVPSTVSSVASQMVTPYGSSYGGRVNLNSQVAPFNMARTTPLSAVLLGASTSTTTTVSAAASLDLASNIYYRVASPTNSLTGAYGKQYGYATAYDSPGEVIEAKGIGDQGETGEALMRDIANLVTARGNVYSVYTVGQSLKQTPAGTLTVTGEQRIQAMVERYLYDPDNNAATSNSVVRFRPVYYRNLVP